jgi:alpha-glucosidase
MKKTIFLLFLMISGSVTAQKLSVKSPDEKIEVNISNYEKLIYSVNFKGNPVINPSILGFEFRDEPAMSGNFAVVDQSVKKFDETWVPVIKSKHSEILNNYNEMHLMLKEISGAMRQMELFIRAYNDGVAFRYFLSRSTKIGDRQITKELTTFSIPGDPKAWIVEYGGYSSSNESEFKEHSLSYLNEKSIAGMPMLMEYGKDCWVAITEAKIDNYAAFYIGTNGNRNQLTTKLVPVPGEEETGVKVRFADELFTPWRVIMIGETPGTLIESELIQNLNDPCAIRDPSWIKPGMSAWDHWWSG